GQLSHAGVVLVAIGIAFAANLGAHAETELSPGDSVEFEGYTITHESPFRRSTESRTTIGVRMTVTRGGSFIGMMEPAANFFGGDQSGVPTPDVLHRPGGDLYLTMLGLPTSDGTATLALDTSPMIWILWLGGLTTVAGGFTAMVARRRERRLAVEPLTVDV
ncbi:MAG: cytochrome c-type biogenesis CcmF C-terminal domain-containing protein, partial [Acidimicrobiia bacterium]